MGTKTGRLDFRVEPEDKEAIEKAAFLSGQTVSGFAKRVLSLAARQVILTHQETILSQHDADIFLSMLAADDEPNEALMRASKRYRNHRHA